MVDPSQSPESKLTRVFSRTPSSWDPQDDLLLRHLKEEQKLGWKEIASHFSNRTPNACQFRWRRLRSGSLKTTTPAAAAAAAVATAAVMTPGSSANSTPTASSAASGSTPPATQKDISTSPSVSPPPRSSSLGQRRGSKPIAVPSYNQWNFSQGSQSSMLNSRRDEAGTDPLSSSVNSLSSGDEMPMSERNLSTSTAATKIWTSDEDDLLLARRKRELSFAELSILLPSRTEGEIWSRIDELETRSKSTSAIDFREATKMQYLSSTPQRKRHSHSHHHSTSGHFTPSQGRKSERSFSVSSQTSVSSMSFLTGDGVMRSNSFSYMPPVLFNNVQQPAVSERYILRKESMSNPTPPQPFKIRSNSIFKTCLATSAIDDDDEDDEGEAEKMESKDKALPPLGALFTEYFAK